MNAWRMFVVLTALVPVIALSRCGPKQPAGPDADRGQCFQQAACIGGSLLQDQPPTLNQCKAAGGKVIAHLGSATARQGARSWRLSDCKIKVDAVTGGLIQALCDARDRPQRAQPRGEG